MYKEPVRWLNPLILSTLNETRMLEVGFFINFTTFS